MKFMTPTPPVVRMHCVHMLVSLGSHTCAGGPDEHSRLGWALHSHGNDEDSVDEVVVHTSVFASAKRIAAGDDTYSSLYLAKSPRFRIVTMIMLCEPCKLATDDSGADAFPVGSRHSNPRELAASRSSS